MVSSGRLVVGTTADHSGHIPVKGNGQLDMW